MAVRDAWQSGVYFGLATCLTVVPKAMPVPKQHWSVDNRPAAAPAILFQSCGFWKDESQPRLRTSPCPGITTLAHSSRFQGLHQSQGAPGANVGSLKLPRTEPRDGCYGSVQVAPKPVEHQRKTQFRQSLFAHYQTSLGTTAYTSYPDITSQTWRSKKSFDVAWWVNR